MSKIQVNGHQGVSRRAVSRCLLIISVCVALLLLGVQEGIAASETSVAPTPEKAKITREFSFEVGEDAPRIEERLVDEDGTVYILKEVGDPIQNTRLISEKSFSLLVERPVSVEMFDLGEAAVRNRFDQLLSVDTGEYAGTVRLQSFTSAPVYRTSENQVERTVVIPDLPSEDVAQLPTSGVFTVASDTGLDETVDETLERLAVTWETTAFDGYGRPARYQATVVYRGVERELLVDYYRVTATYAGTLSEVVKSQTVIATYEEEQKARIVSVNKPLAATTTVLPATTAAGLNLPFVVAVASVAVVMLLALIFLLYFFLYKNARLACVALSGKRKVLERKHLRLQGEELVYKIDPSHQLYRSDASYQILLNNRLTSKQGQLLIFWGDRLISRTNIKPVTNVTEELVKSVSEGLDQILDEPNMTSQAVSGEQK